MKKKGAQPKVRTCKHCKCTERRACVGGPWDTCAWVSRNECSACRPDLLERMLAAAGRRVPRTITTGKKRKKNMNPNDNETQTAEETTALPLREAADQAAAAPGQETQDSLDVDVSVPDAPDATAANVVNGEV